MAKLNGVFVSEDATKIIVGGVEYVKSAGKAEAGDIMRITSTNGSYLTNNAFYDVTRSNGRDPMVIDNCGDEIYVSASKFNVFKRAKAAAEPAPKYREVKRKARVGERIKIVAAESGETYRNGDIFTVTEADRWGCGGGVSTKETYGGIYHSEYIVLESADEPVEAAPAALSVGDYAKVTKDIYEYRAGDIVLLQSLTEEWSSFDFGIVSIRTGSTGYVGSSFIVRATDEEVAAAKAEVERKKAEEREAEERKEFVKGAKVRLTIAEGCRPKYGWGDVKNGDIGTITSVSGKDVCVDFPSQAGWIGLISEFTVLTAEEAAEIERKQAEEAKWAAIGRKVGEYKKGDIVRITKYQHGDPKGTLVIVRNVRVDGSVSYRSTDGGCMYGASAGHFEFVAPVEALFNGGAAV